MLDQCVCIDVDEMAEVFSERDINGRKDHKCCECRVIIPKGTTHNLAKGLWDGEWSQFRTCVPCYNMRESLFVCGFEYGEMGTHVREELGMDPFTGEVYNEETTEWEFPTPTKDGDSDDG